jgi:hypothetical protein
VVRDDDGWEPDSDEPSSGGEEEEAAGGAAWQHHDDRALLKTLQFELYCLQKVERQRARLVAQGYDLPDTIPFD